MKTLFSADWHIKLGQKNVPVNWARARYDSFFHQIHLLEEEADLHIIGGDVFDRVPTLDELELYFSFVRGCSIETIIYDGNHEATRKNKTFFNALKDVTHSLNSLVTVIDEAYEDPRGFSILPYCDLHKKGSIEMLNKKYPVFTHVRGEIPPHVSPEVDLERLSAQLLQLRPLVEQVVVAELARSLPEAANRELSERVRMLLEGFLRSADSQ